MQCKKKHLYCEQWKMLRSRPFSTNPFRLHLSREKMLFLVENYGTCHTMECVLGKFHWILRKTIFTLYFFWKNFWVHGMVDGYPINIPLQFLHELIKDMIWFVPSIILYVLKKKISKKQQNIGFEFLFFFRNQIT